MQQTKSHRFNFWYHIPSAMKPDIWRPVTIYDRKSDKDAAKAAVLTHYRGSVYPEEVEIHVSLRPGLGKIRRFKMTEETPGRSYKAERIDLSSEALELQRRIRAGEAKAPI